MTSLLEEYLERSWICASGRSHHVSLREAHIGSGLLASLPSLFDRLSLPFPKFLLVADERTWPAAGEAVKRVFETAGKKVDCFFLHEPHATEEAVSSLEERLGPLDGLVLAVGSGTINDLCKAACDRLHRPYIVVATAPSMNGYASSVAALERKGVKRTDSVMPPVAVYADTEILANAPIAMVAAGVGDLYGKLVADRDWSLASVLANDKAYCSCAGGMVEAAEASVRSQAAAVKVRKPEALGMLQEGLILSGMAMEAAGSSSPASGGEHLVSHFLDLMAPHQNRLQALHGSQVAMGTILSLELYERLLPLSGQELLSSRAIEYASEKLGGLLEQARKDLTFLPEGVFKELCFETTAKIQAWESFGEKGVESLRQFWDSHREQWSKVLPSPDAHRKVLSEAGAAPDEQACGGSKETLTLALTYGLLMRRRVTILDLALTAGILPHTAAAIVERHW